MKQANWDAHPHVRSGDDLTAGERAADLAVRGMGSWLFLIVQSVFIGAWMVLNTVAWFHHWDPMPFILLNLAFSVQAAYAAPLVLLAGRRQDQRDSEHAQHTMQLIKEIHAHLNDGKDR